MMFRESDVGAMMMTMIHDDDGIRADALVSHPLSEMEELTRNDKQNNNTCQVVVHRVLRSKPPGQGNIGNPQKATSAIPKVSYVPSLTDLSVGGPPLTRDLLWNNNDNEECNGDPGP